MTPELTATLYRPRPHEQVRRRLGHVILELVEGPGTGARFEVTTTKVTLGRGAHNDIVIDDAALSASHAEVSLDALQVIVRDLGSRNGTWIGPARIIDRAALPDGAEFIAGACRFAVHFAGEIDVPMSPDTVFHQMRGTSEPMRELFAMLDRLAPTPLTVLVLGETGTGKEEVARALHAASGRQGPFVVLDCGALPRDLAEAAVFGHARGAFTGATADRAGCFEEANGGTLFLDEIGELPPDLQPKLLRALDRHEVQRIGEHRTRSVDVRVLAATNRVLRTEVNEQRFRVDLFHRLSQVTVDLPPLRDRKDDIVLLAQHFAALVGQRIGRAFEFEPDALDRLREQYWEGNARQLKHVVERACYLTRTPVISRHELFLDPPPAPSTTTDETLFELPLKEALERLNDGFARRYCERLLSAFEGDLEKVAGHAEYTRKGMRDLLRRLGLRGG